MPYTGVGRLRPAGDIDGDIDLEAIERDYQRRQVERRQRIEERLKWTRPWVKRLWETHDGNDECEFAEFLDPVIGDVDAEEYGSRTGAALTWARGAGGGKDIGPRSFCRRLEWPDERQGGGDGNALQDHAGDEPLDDESALRTNLPRLRARFREVHRRDQAETHRPGTGHLLRNTFIVITQDCVDTVLDPMFHTVDDMWVWAVDPDYDDSAGDGSASGYKGYLRVRYQQLVNNFFALRRFQADEYPMERLWESVEKSRNQAFVSVDPDEQNQFNGSSRNVGSALWHRPPVHVTCVNGELVPWKK